MRWLLPLALLVGCGPTVAEETDTDTDTGGDTDTELPVEIPDYTTAGPARSATDTATLAASNNCALNYTRYRPDGEDGEVLVILVHGFARSQAQMAGWAAHWASWGAEVVTPDMCNLGAFNTNHPRNGEHVAELAQALAGDRPVILAGYSAGGLAVTLAAPTVGPAGVLGLDPVDNDDLGLAAASGISAPVLGLFGEAGQCNANNNGVAMLGAASDDTLLRVSTADHCSFESPTDRICTTLCRRGGEPDEAAVERALLSLTTAFIAWRGGLLPEAEAYFTAGEPQYQSVADAVEAL